ncbi:MULTISPECIES: toll/interleukin-1 receptor domain-containing protein [unclassified Variovorax]|uniref:toll/interleukin-1 receptor domain-containing protein n=1 Tax=unclassified Variovorax TaxID=663243 RepID=UPI003F48642B
MSATSEHPKVFISYSWTDAEHEAFVLDFAIALRNHGVDAVLDKWDLKPGQDKFVFMESMVIEPSVVRVLVICDRKYQEKADARIGGVGTESQIISQELYSKVQQTKFIPVVREYDDDGQPCLPVFMKGRIYIDVSTDERYGEGLDQVLRLIYEQPFHEKPKLGAPPSFVTSSAGASHVRELGAALRAIQEGKANRQGLEAIFVKSLLSEIDKLYVQPEGTDYDEEVYKAIERTKGLRDQVAEYAEAVAAFSADDPAALRSFIKLMEGLGEHFGPPATAGRYNPGWSEIYSFFALEILLIQTAALARHERWKSLRRLFTTTFIVSDSQGQPKPSNYFAFGGHLNSLDEHRNKRLQLNRVSVTADLLKERCSPDKTTFSELAEADVLLCLESVVRAGADSTETWPRFWSPRTNVYYSYASKLPLFMRAADVEIRNGIRSVIGVSTGAELKNRLESASKQLDGFSRLKRGMFSDFDFLVAINANELTR